MGDHIMKDSEKLEVFRKKQDAYMVKIKDLLFSKNSPFKNEIYELFYLSQFGESLEIYVFYKNNKILLYNLQNGRTENIKTFILEKLNESGYFKEFNKNVLFVFDSDENVKKKYKGNYFLRLC